MRRVETLTSFIGYAGLAITGSFVAVNLLQYEVGVDLPWNPWDTLLDATENTPGRIPVDLLILFGPVIAIAAFLLPMLKISFGGDDQQIVTVFVRRTSLTRIVVIAASVGVMAILGTYLFFENLPCILGEQVTC